MRRLFCTRAGPAWVAALLISLACAAPLSAVPPVLEALFPAGGQRGSGFTVTATGKIDPDVHLWTSCPGLTLTPTGKKREWQATIPADAPLGLYLVRAWNAEGASDARWFSVGALPEMAEVEPNDEVLKGQVVDKLPVCINARLDKGDDVDGYAMKLEAGQTLYGMVEAYTLGSPLDVMAHIIDDQGIRILTISDGRNLDPVIVFKAPNAGKYTVQLAAFAHPPVADVRFTGGPAAVYRLHLTAGPVVTQIYPAVMAASGKTEVELRGYNLDPKKTRFTVDAAQCRALGDTLLVQVPDALTPLQVWPETKAAMMEKEPNNTRDQAQAVDALPTALGAQITGKGDVDRYSVTMKKGDKVEARIKATVLGLPLDATLQVEGPDGQSVTSANDQGDDADPLAAWTASVDGIFQILVQDQFHRGGENATYVLELGPPAPKGKVAATLVDLKPVVLEPGKSVSIKVQVKGLKGSKEPHVLRVGNLPQDVYAADVPLPEKSGEVEIKLQAAANAVPGQRPFTVSLWSTLEPVQATAVQAPLRGENLRGTSLLDFSDQAWLIVRKGK